MQTPESKLSGVEMRWLCGESQISENTQQNGTHESEARAYRQEIDPQG
jgi:hypothetical protein